MLKTCSYCGRVHDTSLDCGKKPTYRKKRTDATEFHWSAAWQRKREEVKALDGYVCVCCRDGEPGTTRQYETDNLEVHHIVPIAEDYELRLDNDNLITLCRTHHEAAESGRIGREKLRFKTRKRA